MSNLFKQVKMRVIRGLGLGFIGLLLFPSLNIIIIIIYLFIYFSCVLRRMDNITKL